MIKTRSEMMAIAVLATVLILSTVQATLAPITYDEAFTFAVFAKTPIGEILDNQSFPNNHILHTIEYL